MASAPVTAVTKCEVVKYPLEDVPRHNRTKGNLPGYSGAAYLSDGRLVAVDNNNKLCCLLDGCYIVTAEVALPCKPSNLVVTGETEVAVALPSNSQIQMVTVDGSTLKLGRTIACERTPSCIAAAGKTDLVVGWNAGFSFISLSGEERNYVRTDGNRQTIRFGVDDRIAVDMKRSCVYHTSWNTSSLYSYSLDGRLLFTYSQDVKYCSGLALDRDGNVYICSKNTDSVHQVSPAGQRVSVIDTGMDGPFTLCFNRAGDELLVLDYLTYKALGVKFLPPKKVQTSGKTSKTSKTSKLSKTSKPLVRRT